MSNQQTYQNLRDRLERCEGILENDSGHQIFKKMKALEKLMLDTIDAALSEKSKS